jgi:hypothetical protein
MTHTKYEALKLAAKDVVAFWKDPQDYGDEGLLRLQMAIDQLDAAIKQAQPAPVLEPYGYVSTHTSGLMHFNKTFQGVYTDTATEIVAVYTAPPAQPAPVPMAHIVGEIDHTGKVWAPATQPAQRQWVGLTDEEVWDLWNSHTEQPFPEWFVDFKRAYKVLEAKLKEKNT